MSTVPRRITSAAALIASATSVVAFAAMYTGVSEKLQSNAFLAANSFLILAVATPLAAGLLALASRSWIRILAICAFVPAFAAATLFVAFELIPSVAGALPGMTFAMAGFVLVELALPLSALLVGIAALTLMIQEAALWKNGRESRMGMVDKRVKQTAEVTE